MDAPRQVYDQTSDYAAGSQKSQAASGCDADVRLRKFGWRIVSRPRDGEPLWEQDGLVLPQSEVEEAIAELLEDLEKRWRR